MMNWWLHVLIMVIGACGFVFLFVFLATVIVYLLGEFLAWVWNTPDNASRNIAKQTQYTKQKGIWFKIGYYIQYFVHDYYQSFRLRPITGGNSI